MKNGLKDYIRHFFWILSYYNISVLVFYIAALLCTVVSEMFIPVEIGNIVRGLVTEHNNNFVIGHIYIVIGLAVFSTLFTVIMNILRVRMKENPVFGIQKNLLFKLFNLGVPYFEKREKENTFLLYSSIIPMVSDIINRCIPELLRNFITIIVSMILFMRYSGGYCILVVLSMLPSLWIHKYFNKKITEMMTEQIDKHKLFNTKIMTSISAMKEIRYYQCEAWIQNKVTNTNTDYVNTRLSTLKVRYTRGMFFRLNTALGITLYFALATYGFYAGLLEINDFIASLFFCTTLIFALNGLIFNITETIPALEYVKELRKIFDLTEKNTSCFKNKEIRSLQQELQVNVNYFSYGEEPPILMNLNFKIKKGEKVIFIGKSGAGKTTLLKLIANMYQLEKGMILWDSIEYKNINPVLLRQKIGFMFQETYLFGKSIYENIKIGNPEASDGQIYEAAQRACVDSFVKRFPMGYETNVGERGVLLSTGQMQRIAIARLILKNPDIIILDEITSNLDSETEKTIMDNIFHEVFRDKTIIAVSHKTTVLHYFDRFLHIDHLGIKEIRREAAYELA